MFVDAESTPGTLDDRAGAWSLCERSGVLLVTNRLAFLDRYWRPSLVPFLKMQASMLARPDLNSPDYQMLTEFLDRTTPRQRALWHNAAFYGFGMYRGLDISQIGRIEPALCLWRSLEDKDRQQIMRTLQTQPTATFPLGRLAPGTFTHLQTIMQGFAFDYPQSWRPDFAELMAKCTLEIDYDEGNRNRPPGLKLSVLTPEKHYLFAAVLWGLPVPIPHALQTTPATGR